MTFPDHGSSQICNDTFAVKTSIFEYRTENSAFSANGINNAHLRVPASTQQKTDLSIWACVKMGVAFRLACLSNHPKTGTRKKHTPRKEHKTHTHTHRPKHTPSTMLLPGCPGRYFLGPACESWARDVLPTQTKCPNYSHHVPQIPEVAPLHRLCLQQVTWHLHDFFPTPTPPIFPVSIPTDPHKSTEDRATLPPVTRPGVHPCAGGPVPTPGGIGGRGFGSIEGIGRKQLPNFVGLPPTWAALRSPAKRDSLLVG